jgi:hypothetical protein
MKHLLSILFLLLNCSAFSQQTDINNAGLHEITIPVIKGQLDFLASDWTEGRETGEKGMFMAADYIASMFQVYGTAPAGDIETIIPKRAERQKGKQMQKIRTWFQDFSLIKYKTSPDQAFEIITTNSESRTKLTLNYKTDYYMQVPSIGSGFEGQVVFAGYGLCDPENGYNDYENIDIKGKIVVYLEGYPGHNDSNSIAYKKFRKLTEHIESLPVYNKERIAAGKGAVAIIEIPDEGTSMPEITKNYPVRFNSSVYEGDAEMPQNKFRYSIPSDSIKSAVPQFSLSRRAVNSLLDGTGINIRQFEKDLAQTPKPASGILKNKSISYKITVESELITTRNVLAMVKGADTSKCIVIGAHYDHLGMYDGYIWNGADDNASGTVGVMTLAKAFVASNVKPAVNLIFAAWTGEEKGLLGSKYYVQHTPKDHGKVVLNMNFDMISRNSTKDTLGNEFSVSYLKGYSQLKDISESTQKTFEPEMKIKMRESAGKGGGSDNAPFAAKGIPFVSYMAGFHDDYHNPGDEISKANYKKMCGIIRHAYLNILEIQSKKCWLKE